MAVRDRLTSLLHTTVSGVRTAWDEAASPPADIGALEARIRTLESSASGRIQALEDRLRALEDADERLRKRLSMTVGAIQAATAQLMQLREALAQTQNQAQQAMQRATTALSTAEAAADGITHLEGTRPAAEE